MMSHTPHTHIVKRFSLWSALACLLMVGASLLAWTWNGLPAAIAERQPQPLLAAAPVEAARTLALPPQPDNLLARGQALYERQCAVCHGDNGDGAGPFAYLMNPRPRNFLSGKFRLTTTQNLVPSDEDLLRTITRGMPGSAMPPWGHLSDADLKALVAYVRELTVIGARADIDAGVKVGIFEKEEVPSLVAERTQPGPPLIVPPESPFDDVHWFSGRRIYIEGCAACHGIDGEPIAEAVKEDDDGFPLPPRSFVNGIFKGGMEGPQLYARILKGMRGSPMPAYEGTYTDEELWDLIHYVQSLARPGAQDRAQLRQSTIVAPLASSGLPAGPNDAAWDQARPAYVGLTPLWWTPNRIEGLVVQALHDGEELALRLSWIDPTQDDRAVLGDEFRDGVAIQFSLTSDPPFYMGDRREGGGVNIWMWKADRDADIEKGHQDVGTAFPDRAVDMYPEYAAHFEQQPTVDWPLGPTAAHNPTYISAWGAGNLVADPTLKTPVECLVARGPGTLSGKPANVQIVQGASVYDRGMWRVQMQRTLLLPQDHAGEGCDHGDERVFRPGDYLPVSFAVWDGSSGDRDGKKNISIWQKLVIE